MEFNDRRISRSGLAARGGMGGNGTDTRWPTPRTKAEMNGHLVNDHEHTAGGAGNSARNLPSAAELRKQHDDLHADGASHDHPAKWKR